MARPWDQERHSIHGKNYTAIDINTNRRVWFPTEHLHHDGPIQQQPGHPDGRYSLTLLPEVPVKITYLFALVGQWSRRDPGKGLTFSPRTTDFKGEEFRRYFEPWA